MEKREESFSKEVWTKGLTDLKILKDGSSKIINSGEEKEVYKKEIW